MSQHKTHLIAYPKMGHSSPFKIKKSFSGPRKGVPLLSQQKLLFLSHGHTEKLISKSGPLEKRPFLGFCCALITHLCFSQIGGFARKMFYVLILLAQFCMYVKQGKYYTDIIMYIVDNVVKTSFKNGSQITTIMFYCGFYEGISTYYILLCYL